MIAKIKAFLLTAAGLVASIGVAIGIALNQSATAHELTPREWSYLVSRANNLEHQYLFYLEVADQAAIPKESDGRILGDCSAGACTIVPDALPDMPISYAYSCGPLVSGVRICEVQSHRYFAKGWYNEAQSNAQYVWLGGPGEVILACKLRHSGADCISMLDAPSRRLLLADDRTCWHGRVLGDETTACPYVDAVAIIPPEGRRGTNGWRHDVAKTWAPEDMDEL